MRRTAWTIYKSHATLVGNGAYCVCAICESLRIRKLDEVEQRAVDSNDHTARMLAFICEHNRGKCSKRDFQAYCV